MDAPVDDPEDDPRKSFMDSGKAIFTGDMVDNGNITVAPNSGTHTINLPSSPNTGGGWIVTSTGTGGNTVKYAGGFTTPDATETPTEVLGDHLNYLENRKDDFEKRLDTLTKQYGECEEQLNQVVGAIKATEDAIKLISKGRGE